MDTQTEGKSLYELAREVPGSVSFRAMMNAESEEERNFWSYVYHMNLQRSQKFAIENNLF